MVALNAKAGSQHMPHASDHVVLENVVQFRNGARTKYSCSFDLTCHFDVWEHHVKCKLVGPSVITADNLCQVGQKGVAG